MISILKEDIVYIEGADALEDRLNNIPEVLNTIKILKCANIESGKYFISEDYLNFYKLVIPYNVGITIDSLMGVLNKLYGHKVTFKDGTLCIQLAPEFSTILGYYSELDNTIQVTIPCDYTKDIFIEKLSDASETRLIKLLNKEFSRLDA